MPIATVPENTQGFAASRLATETLLRSVWDNPAALSLGRGPRRQKTGYHQLVQCKRNRARSGNPNFPQRGPTGSGTKRPRKSFLAASDFAGAGLRPQLRTGKGAASSGPDLAVSAPTGVDHL